MDCAADWIRPFRFHRALLVGSSLLFVKSIEGKSASDKLAQISMFPLIVGAAGTCSCRTRNGISWLPTSGMARLRNPVPHGGLALFGWKVAAVCCLFWICAGAVFRQEWPASLGALFTFNIPACAAPLIVALLGMAAAGGAGGAPLIRGFISMMLFGFALSLPIIAIALFPWARRVLDHVASLSRRMPRWTGMVLIILGLWSIWFGVFVSPA